MKSIKEKAEAYDKVLEWATEAHKVCDGMLKEDLEHLFPELKESEDEKVKKALIEMVHDFTGDSLWVDYNIHKEEALAWLEKQGEQKSDEVVEEEKSLLERFKKAVYACAWEKVTCKVEGETKEEYANRWAEQFLLIVRNWADDYIDFTIQQKLRNSYEKGKTDVIEKQGEQKSTWSEEDENRINRLIAYFEDKESFTAEDGIAYANWLESLKDILQVQPKQEWSEKDEKTWEELIEEVKDQIDSVPAPGCRVKEDEKVLKQLNKWLTWLKSLKDRHTWKPSEEQMKALNYVVNLMASSESPKENDYYYNVFKDLREQLKKLRGE